MKRLINGVALAIALTLPNFLSPMQAQSPPILLSQNVNFTPPDVIDPYYRRQGTPKGSA